MDSYNQIVKATRQYVAQNVRGGLGTGGALAVQGAQTPAVSGGVASATAPTMSVADAQRKLAKLGYNPGPSDGQMGGRTASALRAFQRDRNLAQTGQLDAPTIAELVK
jgi:peptidoglycan hydrolase-like protein with peptidoglycan-binding domain